MDNKIKEISIVKSRNRLGEISHPPVFATQILFPEEVLIQKLHQQTSPPLGTWRCYCCWWKMFQLVQNPWSHPSDLLQKGPLGWHCPWKALQKWKTMRTRRGDTFVRYNFPNKITTPVSDKQVVWRNILLLEVPRGSKSSKSSSLFDGAADAYLPESGDFFPLDTLSWSVLHIQN